MGRDYIKIAVTGGPGAGKTTALDLFQRELKHKVKVVPEAATMLFQNGVKREEDFEKIMVLQKTIYCIQEQMENSFHELNPDRHLICDRGSLDGLAYWPNGEEHFFQTIGSNFEREISRYDAVIFFQTSAAHGDEMKSNNPYRLEQSSEALILDEKLKVVWQRHPNFHYIPSESSFLKKITHGLLTINQVLLEQIKKR